MTTARPAGCWGPSQRIVAVAAALATPTKSWYVGIAIEPPRYEVGNHNPSSGAAAATLVIRGQRHTLRFSLPHAPAGGGLLCDTRSKPQGESQPPAPVETLPIVTIRFDDSRRFDLPLLYEGELRSIAQFFPFRVSRPTTGQAGATVRHLQRRGAWELIAGAASEAEQGAAFSRVEPEDWAKERARMRQHQARFLGPHPQSATGQAAVGSAPAGVVRAPCRCRRVTFAQLHREVFLLAVLDSAQDQWPIQISTVNKAVAGRVSAICHPFCQWGGATMRPR